MSTGAHQAQRLVDSASNYATIRVRNAGLALKDAKNVSINKVDRDDVGKAVETTVTWTKNNFNLGEIAVTPHSGLMRVPKHFGNTHMAGNTVKDFLSKFEGINLKPRGEEDFMGRGY